MVFAVCVWTEFAFVFAVESLPAVWVVVLFAVSEAVELAVVPPALVAVAVVASDALSVTVLVVPVVSVEVVVDPSGLVDVNVLEVLLA